MNGGYSWTNTSQWSQIPTVPVDQNNPAPSTNTPPQPNTAPTQSYAPQPQSNTYNNNLNQTGYSAPQPQPRTSTEPRRDMISRLYKQILGREPDNAGLNYYLFNTNIDELTIALDMYGSTEHLDLLNKAKDVRSMIVKLDGYTKQVNELQTKLQNAENLSANYKLLLDQKTQIINSLKSADGTGAQTGSNPSEQNSPQSANLQNSTEQKQQQENDASGLLLDDPFANENKKGKGCFGFIKNIFRFE